MKSPSKTLMVTQPTTIQPATVHLTNAADIVHNAERSDRPCSPPSPLYNGYRVKPGGRAAVAWC